MTYMEREKLTVLIDVFFKILFYVYVSFYAQMSTTAVTCGNTFILKPSEKDPGDC